MSSEKKKNPKTLWRGLFNYSHEICIEYIHAFSPEQAKVIMCRRLAKKHEVHPSHVFALFDGSRDNFSIAVETEFEEKDDG